MVLDGSLSVQRVCSAADLERIEFHDGLALVEVAIEALDLLPLVNVDRPDTPRLTRLVESIRVRGYEDLSPIRVQITADGKWVVIDGGHRIVAARQVAREWLTNLLGRKVSRLTFLVAQAKGAAPKSGPEAESEPA